MASVANAAFVPSSLRWRSALWSLPVPVPASFALTRRFVPVVMSRRNTSMATPLRLVSLVRSVACEAKATKRPSGLIDVGPFDAESAVAPPASRMLTSFVAPGDQDVMSFRKTSSSPFESALAVRSVAAEAKPTHRPSGVMLGA